MITKLLSNKHTKMALLVAPFLAIIGWIGSDIWLESQKMKSALYSLTLENGLCDVTKQHCVVSTGDIKFTLYQHKQNTFLNGTLPMDDAVIMLVDADGSAVSKQMTMVKEQYQYYWQAQLPANTWQTPQVFRLIIRTKGAQYIGEFENTPSLNSESR